MVIKLAWRSQSYPPVTPPGKGLLTVTAEKEAAAPPKGVMVDDEEPPNGVMAEAWLL